LITLTFSTVKIAVSCKRYASRVKELTATGHTQTQVLSDFLMLTCYRHKYVVTINRYNKPSSATMSQRALLPRISHYMFRLLIKSSSGVSNIE
jgi:hypothetical protein